MSKDEDPRVLTRDALGSAGITYHEGILKPEALLKECPQASILTRFLLDFKHIIASERWEELDPGTKSQVSEVEKAHVMIPEKQPRAKAHEQTKREFENRYNITRCEANFGLALEIKKTVRNIISEDEDRWIEAVQCVFKRLRDASRDAEGDGARRTAADVIGRYRCDTNHTWEFGRGVLQQYSQKTKSKLKAPKPDLFLSFHAYMQGEKECGPLSGDDYIENFGMTRLNRLYEKYRLMAKRHPDLPFGFSPSPCKEFYSEKDVKNRTCFPWAVCECKHQGKIDTSFEEYLHCQAANAAAVCLTLFANAAAGGRSSPVLSEIRPVVCMTFVGPRTKVWIAYVTAIENFCYRYRMRCIWEGSLDNVLDNIKLCVIIENLHFWAMNHLRPWLSGCIDQWTRVIDDFEAESSRPKPMILSEKQPVKPNQSKARAPIFGTSQPTVRASTVQASNDSVHTHFEAEAPIFGPDQSKVSAPMFGTNQSKVSAPRFGPDQSKISAPIFGTDQSTVRASTVQASNDSVYTRFEGEAPRFGPDQSKVSAPIFGTNQSKPGSQLFQQNVASSCSNVGGPLGSTNVVGGGLFGSTNVVGGGLFGSTNVVGGGLFGSTNVVGGGLFGSTNVVGAPISGTNQSKPGSQLFQQNVASSCSNVGGPLGSMNVVGGGLFGSTNVVGGGLFGSTNVVGGGLFGSTNVVGAPISDTNQSKPGSRLFQKNVASSCSNVGGPLGSMNVVGGGLFGSTNVVGAPISDTNQSKPGSQLFGQNVASSRSNVGSGFGSTNVVGSAFGSTNVKVGSAFGSTNVKVVNAFGDRIIQQSYSHGRSNFALRRANTLESCLDRDGDHANSDDTPESSEDGDEDEDEDEDEGEDEDEDEDEDTEDGDADYEPGSEEEEAEEREDKIDIALQQLRKSLRNNRRGMRALDIIEMCL